MELTIEKGVPIPPTWRTGRNNRSAITAALYQLEVGDSVVVPVLSDRVGGRLEPLRRKGRRFTVRKVDANSCRVWRLLDAEVSA